MANCFVKSDFEGTSFLCSDESACPTGQACFEGRCSDGPPPGMADASLDPDAAAPPPPIGDVFTFTFDEPEINLVNVFDRSGNSHTAWASSNQLVGPGKFDLGKVFAADNTSSQVRVPYYEAIKPHAPLTLEVWLNRDQQGVGQALISDFSAATNGLIRLAIDASDQPVLALRDGCDGDIETIAATGTVIPALEWTHLAVVLSAESVEFFVNGQSVHSAPNEQAPCNQPLVSSLSIGYDRDGSSPFVGTLDDVKWSSRSKTVAEIQASMDFDSAAAAIGCGDGIIESGEACEPSAQCCSEVCAFETATSCEGGDCADGRCSVPAARSDQDLLVRYSFTEGSGLTVNDSGPGAPIDLAIDALTNVSWVADGLRIDGAVRIGSALPASKITDAARASGSFSVEAWVTPNSISVSGPARLFTVSASSLERNVTLGQQERGWVGRFRTHRSSFNGLPSVIGPAGDAAVGRLSHVVATYSPGRSRLYVDGRLRGSSPLNGDLSQWDGTYGVSVGNEFVDDRLWLGTLHHIAAFSRELSAEDVAAHFAFGVPAQSK